MADLTARPQKFAFIFPMASGHINPSLPVARTLVEEGHEVRYLCREQMQEAIEDTGATFYSELEELREMYEGRKPDILACLTDFQNEYGLGEEPLFAAMMKLREIMQEKMLPGILRWLRRTQAELLVCCPLMNKESAWAAKILGIPCVGIMTTAGPGSMHYATLDMMEKMGITPEQCREDRHVFQPLLDAVDRMRSQYGLEIDLDEELKPIGTCSVALNSALTLVTTVELLADPLTPELQDIYAAAGTEFVYVGPLLDKTGAKRAAGHKLEQDVPEAKCDDSIDPLEELRKAKAAGRPVVFASMGTVITGDSPEVGWANRMKVNGEEAGLSGKELCQAAWGALFDVLGTESAEEGPLLLMSLGPQPDALADLTAPKNACYLPVMPQVDILKAGPDLFLTHGGQNSFMESLSSGVPVVVCPGFADQPTNAQKAVTLGVGLKVDRPQCDLKEVDEHVAKYRKATAAAVREVFGNQKFKTKAAECAKQMQSAGGVRKATDLILEVATSAGKRSKLGGA